MNKLNEENLEKNIKNQISQNSPLSTEQKLQESTISEPKKQSQKLTYLIKAIQDFSNRYKTDSLNILTDKKFLLSFTQIISLIKDVVEYQNKIFKIDISEKEKIQEISQDFGNKLSYTIFSYEKIDVLNNEKRKNKSNSKIKNQIFINKKKEKEKPKFSFSNSNITSSYNNNNNIEENGNKNNKAMPKYFSSNYLKEIEGKKNKSKKNEEIKIKNKIKKEIKIYNTNIKPRRNDKKNINNKIFKTFHKSKNKEIKNLTEGNIINKKEEKNKIDKSKNSKILNTNIYSTNIRTNYKNPSTSRNSEKKHLNTFNGQFGYALKNNSVILRSGSLKNKNNNNSDVNTMEAYNFYNTFNDFEQKLLGCQTIKEGYIINGKINIFSNVPKPSILANKLLESSIKYINDYNGVNEEEKKKNSFNHSHSHSQKKNHKKKK